MVFTRLADVGIVLSNAADVLRAKRQAEGKRVCGSDSADTGIRLLVSMFDGYSARTNSCAPMTALRCAATVHC